MYHTYIMILRGIKHVRYLASNLGDFTHSNMVIICYNSMHVILLKTKQYEIGNTKKARLTIKLGNSACQLQNLRLCEHIELQ